MCHCLPVCLRSCLLSACLPAFPSQSRVTAPLSNLWGTAELRRVRDDNMVKLAKDGGGGEDCEH